MLNLRPYAVIAPWIIKNNLWDWKLSLHVTKITSIWLSYARCAKRHHKNLFLIMSSTMNVYLWVRLRFQFPPLQWAAFKFSFHLMLCLERVTRWRENGWCCYFERRRSIFVVEMHFVINQCRNSIINQFIWLQRIRKHFCSPFSENLSSVNSLRILSSETSKQKLIKLHMSCCSFHPSRRFNFSGRGLKFYFA